jgi:hypothetical protein
MNTTYTPEYGEYVSTSGIQRTVRLTARGGFLWNLETERATPKNVEFNELTNRLSVTNPCIH